VNLLGIVVLTLTVVQGEAVRLEIPNEEGLVAVEASWNDRFIPFVRRDAVWFTIVGVDLAAAPGEHQAAIVLKFADGHEKRQVESVTVRSKEFPTTYLTVEPKYVELGVEDQARATRERAEIDAIYSKLTPEAYWRGAFEVPIPGVTGGRNFGHRRFFNEQPRAPHSGADLKAAKGTEIRAANRGRVVLAKDLFYSGNAVFIDHGLGVYTVYLHLSEILVEPGAMVEQGEVVGLAGATGRVTGPHLHWGARIIDSRVDPFSLLKL